MVFEFLCEFGTHLSVKKVFQFVQEGYVILGSMCRQSFYLPENEIFTTSNFSEERAHVITFLKDALQEKQPRDDYRELIELSLLFLGGWEGPFKLRAPGAVHSARWILKLLSFQQQFHMQEEMINLLTSLCVFISLVYCKFWVEAPLALTPPAI